MELWIEQYVEVAYQPQDFPPNMPLFLRKDVVPNVNVTSLLGTFTSPQFHFIL